jgi:hypothetical protein
MATDCTDHVVIEGIARINGEAARVQVCRLLVCHAPRAAACMAVDSRAADAVAVCWAFMWGGAICRLAAGHRWLYANVQ